MKRNRRITITLSDEEFQALTDICGNWVTKSEAIRLMIMATAQECLLVDSDKSDIFQKTYNELTGGRYAELIEKMP